MEEANKSNYATKADEYMKQGDKKLKGGMIGNMFSNKAARAESAVEFYKNAATNYKLCQRWESASHAYLRCAECENIMKSGDSGEYILEAGNMMRKVNSAEAIVLYERAIDLYCEQSRLSNAAKMRTTIAEIYESDGEYSLAAKNYQLAADLYYAESDSTSVCNKMKLKVAELSTLRGEGKLIDAIKIYEEVADKYLENRLTAPGAKDLFFRACLLYLCNEALLAAIEQKNTEKFSDDCYEYNNIIPLDKWKTGILSKIKENLQKNIKSDDLVL